MSKLSEGELHVQAMRLVCEALADREKTGLEVDWDVLCHMHDHMDVIFRGIEDQRRDDQDELMHTRKDRDHWRQARREAIEAGELMRAELEKLRKELDAARSEIEAQRKAMADDSGRLRKAEERVWPGIGSACDPAKAMADEILGLREQLKAADAAVTLQRAGIERLRRFVGGVEGAFGAFQSISPDTCCDQIARCLAELEDSPTPATEPTPCPECERLQAELENANEHRTDLVLFVDKVRNSFRVWGGNESFFHSVSHALDQLDAGTIKPTPVAEPLEHAEGGA